MFTQSAPTGKHLNLAKLQVFGSGRANLKTQTFKPFPRFDRQVTNVNYQKTKKTKVGEVSGDMGRKGEIR